ncbi:MAG: hypothetical protein EOP10_23435 [Proteobacteria bacterium]|nr:MAG: hypothetical protein EOP10_23435 [Pseudomonadota bacterium]
MSLFQRVDIGVDLGTSKYNIFVRGQGLVAQEASLLAYSGPVLKPSSVVAIGEAARDYESSRESITVMSPMRDGVIVNRMAAEILIQRMALNAGLGFSLKKPSTLVTSLLGATGLERKTFLEVAQSIRSSRSLLRDEPLAAANALPVDLSEPFAHLVLDIGAGASEALVLNAGRMVMGRSLRIGGDAINKSLVEYARRQHRLILPLGQARSLKEALSEPLAETDIVLRGMDPLTHLPKRIRCGSDELKAVIDNALDPIVEMIKDLLLELSPGTFVELIENGIYICGGASKTVGLKQKLESVTGLRVLRMNDPEDAVIRGCGQLLNYVRYLGY